MIHQAALLVSLHRLLCPMCGLDTISACRSGAGYTSIYLLLGTCPSLRLLHGLGPTFPVCGPFYVAVYKGINDFHSRSLTRPGGYQQLIRLVNFTCHCFSNPCLRLRPRQNNEVNMRRTASASPQTGHRRRSKSHIRKSTGRDPHSR